MNDSTTYTTGHCSAARQPGGCPHHNLQCGWPNCDRKPIEPQPPAGASVSERARALLADAFRDHGYPRAAESLEAGFTDSLDECALAALEQALTQQREHGTTGSMEQAGKATFVPCDCGCGRSCCAMCGNDVGFLTTPQPGAEALRELQSACEPFIRHNSSEQFIDLRVPTSAVKRLRGLLESLLGRGGK